MNVAYFVSRFPHTTETFILRELNAVSVLSDFRVELFSLFPPLPGAIVHRDASDWIPRVHRARPLRVLLDAIWWAQRRPRSVVHSLITVWKAYAGQPMRRCKALMTVLVACSHARTALEYRTEHVHAHYATYPALAAWVCRALTGIPYSFTVHAHDLYVTKAMLDEKISKAQFVVTVSEYNRRIIHGHCNEEDTPVFIVRCGIDVARYPFRNRLPFGTGRIRGVCVASLQEYKGHTILLQALAAAGPPLQRVSFELVGDGPLRRTLESEVAALGLSDRVLFRGSLPESEVISILDKADLFVLPSVTAKDSQMEGLPVALMEALASGIPVVATRLSGIPELVTERVGVLVEPGDVADLQCALERLVNGETRLDPSEGRRRVEEEFDVRRSARELAELFRGGIGSGDGGPGSRQAASAPLRDRRV